MSIRIVKEQPRYPAPFTKSAGQKVIEFELDPAPHQCYDMANSYLLMDVSLSGGSHAFSKYIFGSPNGYFGSIQYSPSCLFRNTKLSTDNQLLEMNFNRNFYKHNEDQFTIDDQRKNTITKYGYGYDKNDITGAVSYPWLDMKKTGTTSSALKVAKISVPIADLYELGKEMALPADKKLHMRLELEDKLNVIAEHVDSRDPYDVLNEACDGFTGTTGTNLDMITITSTGFTVANFPLKIGDQFYVAFTHGGNDYVLQPTVSALALNGNQIEITTTANIFTDAVVYTAVSVFSSRLGCINVVHGTDDRKRIQLSGYDYTANINNYFREGDNVNVAFKPTGGRANANTQIVRIETSGTSTFITLREDVFTASEDADNISVLNLDMNKYITLATVVAGQDITTVDTYVDEHQIPFHVGEQINIDYIDDATKQKVSVARNITGISWAGANNVAVITVDGAALVAGDANMTGYCYHFNAVPNVLPSWQIDRAELVLTKEDCSRNPAYKKQPIQYTRVFQEAVNRDAVSTWQRIYRLPAGTSQFMFMNYVDDLVAKDDNLQQYRFSLNNEPTTDRMIIPRSSLWNDRVVRVFGHQLNNLKDTNVILPELQTSGSPAPLLDVDLEAKSGSNLNSTQFYLFSKVESILKL